MTLRESLLVFGEGFSLTRSFAHPHEFVPVGPLFVMRDLPRVRGHLRNEEIVIEGISPDEAIAAIRQYKPGRHFMCVLHGMEADAAALKATYKAFGYRNTGSQPMMVHDLDHIPDPSGIEVRRVTTREDAERIRRAAGGRQILPSHLDSSEAPLRLFYASVQGEPVGWVRSIRTSRQANWVSNMYVIAEFRRRGIATALMATMLRDDAARGAHGSVLLATRVGTALYESIGYRQIGSLLLFSPVRRT